MILATVGKNATGKDYFLEYISKKYKIPMFSIGDIARELAKKEGLEASRDNLHKISKKYMTLYGQTFFPDQILKKIRESNLNDALISGIRPPSDAVTLKEAFKENFILVDIVVSDDNMRFGRMKKRASARDPMVTEKFIEYDKREEELFNTSETESLADFVIYNDGSVEEFYQAADNFYKIYCKIKYMPLITKNIVLVMVCFV
jgi:dephospho-CoA kinase